MTVSTSILDYLGEGTHADRPAAPPIGAGGIAIYYETDTTSAFLWDTAGAAWVAVGGGGGSAAAWIFKSGTYTASASDLIAADTSAGAFTITLPATPAAGATVRIADYLQNFDVHALTVDPNGLKINGLTQNLVLTEAGTDMQFVYQNAGNGWGASGGVAPRVGTYFDPASSTLMTFFSQWRGASALKGAYDNVSALTKNGFRSSGKLYFEFKLLTASPVPGIAQASTPTEIGGTNYGMGSDTTSWGFNTGSAGIHYNNSSIASGSSYFGANDVLGVAVDFSGTLTVYLNNSTWATVSGQTFGAVGPGVTLASNTGSDSVLLCTRAAQCAYSPPAGYSYWDS